MSGIHVHIGHGGEDGGEHHIPVLGGIGIDADLDGLQRLYHGRKCLEGRFEILGYSAALGRAAGELEHDYVLYHNDRMNK